MVQRDNDLRPKELCAEFAVVEDPDGVVPYAEPSLINAEEGKEEVFQVGAEVCHAPRLVGVRKDIGQVDHLLDGVDLRDPEILLAEEGFVGFRQREEDDLDALDILFKLHLYLVLLPFDESNFFVCDVPHWQRKEVREARDILIEPEVIDWRAGVVDDLAHVLVVVVLLRQDYGWALDPFCFSSYQSRQLRQRKFQLILARLAIMGWMVRWLCNFNFHHSVLYLVLSRRPKLLNEVLSNELLPLVTLVALLFLMNPLKVKPEVSRLWQRILAIGRGCSLKALRPGLCVV